MNDTRELTNTLTASFADILYSWKFPPSLNAPQDLPAHRKAVRDYFLSDPMACYVLKALVAASIHDHEWVNLSIPERQRREAEQAIAVERALRDMSLRCWVR